MKPKKLLTTLVLIAVVLIAGCKKDNFVKIVSICPTVASTNPANAATNVALDMIVTATFNEKMNPKTITPESFTLNGATKSSATSVAGTVSYTDSTATFRLSSGLTPNSTYTGKITTSVKDLFGNALQTDYVWTFITGKTLSPTVVSTDPANNEKGVFLNKKVTATFGVPMDPLTLTTTTFIIKQGTTPVTGTVLYTGTTASFTPSSNLLSNTAYTATITSGAKNVSGIALANDYVWTFTTGSITAPTVNSIDPANNATGVLLNKKVTATFSEAMDPLTLTTTTFTIKQGSTSVAGTVSYTGTTASFTPSGNLLSSTIYTATITTGAKNVSGTTLANDYVWTFTTGTITGPTVISSDPAANATGVVINKIITAIFSAPMDPLTLTTTTFTIKQGTTSVAGTVSYTGTTATFTPSGNLLSNTAYTATITTGAKNVSGTPLANDYVWTFTTGSLTAPTVISADPANNATGVALNKIIATTFSVPMDPLTLTATTFTIKQGATPVAGTVSYTGTTASFTPSSNLWSGTAYTATITTGAKNVSGTTLANDYVWTFTTGSVTAPTVTSTNPANNATGVTLNAIVTAAFSVPMDPLTITATTFTVKQGVTSVAGTVSYTGITASFTPSSNLLSSTTYTATITTGAKNVAGTPLSNNYVWTFTTGSITAPTVTSTDPANNETGVALNKIVTAIFSVPMDALTLTATTFTIKQGTTPVAGTVSCIGTTATFTPSGNLLSGPTYTATITTGAKNVPGTPLANNYVWTFTTGSLTAPTVILTDPADNATGVVLNKIVAATFSVPMDPLTLTATTFTIKQGATSVTGTISYIGSTATFTPFSNLLSGTTYTATITTGAKNVSGTSIANDYVWNFSTQASSGPIVVNLNSVARFGIIAGVGVSNNAGFSEIHDMDVGINPGVRSSITGFPPGIIVNGAFYASDDGAAIAAMLIQAKLDLTAAYLFAEGATSPAPATVSGDQGGKTLAPGIYKSTSTLLIQNGDLTLDAQGDANAVWIFQIASGFTTVGGAGGNVILSGGAQAKNVFWQTGSSATIGDYTSFKGNILALTSITMNSHATVTGRILARNGSVVLTSTNIIIKP